MMSLVNSQISVIILTILNRNKHIIPSDAIFIGRGSKWGNPFKIGVDGNRFEVITKYEQWLKTQQHLIDSIEELRDVDLVCFCKPQSCHGDILIKVLTMTLDQRMMWINNSNSFINFFQED